MVYETLLEMQNKFAREKIFITINSDSETTEVIIEDDGTVSQKIF